MQYFLGIDQGGTKTQVAVCAADGTLAGAATGGASVCYLDDPHNTSTVAARVLAESILSRAGLSVDCIGAACGGLSGVDWPHEVPLHEERMRSGLGINDVIAVNDCVIALRAGSNAPYRCIVCAGTGINIAAQDYVYGWFINDRLMGGHALGCQVKDAVVDAAVGVKPPTLLTGAVLAHTGCTSVEEWLIGITTRKIPFSPQFLVPLLLNAVLAGDEAASQIVNQFIKGLAGYLENALTRFFPPLSMDDKECNAELVFSGGVFKGNGYIITDALIALLAPRFPRLTFVNARLEPVCGALLMLLDRHYKGTIPGSVTDNFEKGCVQHGLIRQ